VFLIILFVLAYAAIAFLYGKPEFFDDAGVLRGGANMAVVHLSRLLGGDVLMGIVSAVTFATILAVVAGLTMASAGALAHDLYAQVLRRGAATEEQELRVFRLATLAVTVVAALLGVAFKGTNISFLVSLAFSVARERELSGADAVAVLARSHAARRVDRRRSRSHQLDRHADRRPGDLGGRARLRAAVVRLELSDADRDAARAADGVGGFAARCAPAGCGSAVDSSRR
jgi:hypothetical protein